MEVKNSALLSSFDGYLLEPIEWPKGNQASCGVMREDSGLLSRPCRKRRASPRDDGGIWWGFFFFFFELQQDMWSFSRVTPGNPGSLSCGPREVQSPFELQGGARHCSGVVAGESGLKMHRRGNIEVFLELQQETLASLDL